MLVKSKKNSAEKMLLEKTDSFAEENEIGRMEDVQMKIKVEKTSAKKI